MLLAKFLGQVVKGVILGAFLYIALAELYIASADISIFRYQGF